MPVAGQDGVDEQVDGVQHGPVEARPLGEVEGAEGFLVGVDDSSGAGVGATDGDLAAVGGRVRLLGEEGQYVGLVPGGHADQPAPLGGQKDPSAREAGQDRRLDAPGHPETVALRLGADSYGHRMGLRKTKAEVLGPFREAAEITAHVQEVVDELAARGLFLTDGLLLGALVALDEGVHGLFHHRKQSTGRRGNGPYCLHRRQVIAYQAAQWEAGRHAPLPRVPFGTSRTSPSPDAPMTLP